MAGIHKIVKKTPGGRLSMKTLETLGLPDPVRNIGESAEMQDKLLAKQEEKFKKEGERREKSNLARERAARSGTATTQRKNKSLLG